VAAIKAVPDAMSDVLSLVRMRSNLVCANDCTTPFSLAFHGPDAHFHIFERGFAFLLLEGKAPVRIESGDLVILPLGAGHVLSSNPELPPVPIERAVSELAVRSGSVFRFGTGNGAETHMVCGQFTFAGVLAPRLLSVLPPLIHIKAQEGRPLEWLRLTSNFLAEETRGAKPGSNIMVSRLLDVMFTQALREWAGRSPGSLGWLSGLMDPQVGRALSAIHDAPGRDWTVESLAAISGLSRSAFAARFPAVVGQPPLQYVTQWRLNLAADYLRAGTARVGEIAAIVGYGSEAALIRAFKAQFGTTPAAFRRGAAAPEADTRRR
jgi:AraC-like DNA-binding protein